MASEWGRDTPWRQGHVLPGEAYETLVGRRDDGVIAVVVSHDCDLANDPTSEPTVEVVRCDLVAALDGNFTHGKNARKLHLSFTGGTTRAMVQFQAGAKITISKTDLVHFEPMPDCQMLPQERAVLQRWLAARYRRSAFPDEFDRRLSQSGIAKRLPKILEPLGALISAMYFDLDKGEEIVRGEGEAFELLILLMYIEDGDADTLTKVSKAAIEIDKLFREKFFNPKNGIWTSIELEGCEVISDYAMSVAQANSLRKWNGDFISLRADPQQTVVDE